MQSGLPMLGGYGCSTANSTTLVQVSVNIRLEMEREIFLMCDFASDPVWWSSDGSEADLDEIPLGTKTKALLRAWAVSWEEGICEPQFGHHWTSRADLEAFEREGLRLLKIVRDELGSEWQVGYRSELGVPVRADKPRPSS